MLEKGKWIAVLLAVALLTTMIPATVFAVRIQANTPNITVNTTKVAFAGQTWLVIGDAQKGVYPQADHITLLAANPMKGSKRMEFRTSSSKEKENFHGFEYATKKNPGRTAIRYFADNPTGMVAWKKPYEYAGSALQQEMEDIAETFSEKEQELITGRNLTSADGIAGQAISNQKLWALSLDEWNTIHAGSDDDYVIDWNGDFWWLRTPFEGGKTVSDGVEGRYVRSGNISEEALLYEDYAARPALSLDLSKVLFTSTANATAGKSTATVEAGLMRAQVATGRIKFTVVDSSQHLDLVVAQGQKVQKVKELKFNYSNATSGENQYVSCVLINKNGVAKYYGKLADNSQAASGTISIALNGVANGVYTLQIFSEQANGDLYTDFCSDPVTYTLTVTDGKGTLHVHDWQEPVYTWSEDGTVCIASRKCVGNPEHTQQVQATVTSAQTKAPACTENGETTYTATFTVAWATEQTKTVANIAALGHQPVLMSAKEATCLAEGYTGDQVCTVCGEVVQRGAVIEKLPHHFENGKCTVCGAADPNATVPPKTGDTSNVPLWAALLLVSGVGAWTAAFHQKRRKAK